MQIYILQYESNFLLFFNIEEKKPADDYDHITFLFQPLKIVPMVLCYVLQLTNVYHSPSVVMELQTALILALMSLAVQVLSFA